MASVMSALTDKAIVKKDRLCDVAGRDRYQVNNKHDDKYSPLPPSKIVQQAEELVGQEVLYKLTSENCEHFVNELRYGIPRSDQVRPQCVPIPGNQTISSADLGIRVGWAGLETGAQTRQNSRGRSLPSRMSQLGWGGGWGDGHRGPVWSGDDGRGCENSRHCQPGARPSLALRWTLPTTSEAGFTIPLHRCGN